MKELYLKYTDHELFDTMYIPEHYHFISSHMDAFKHMWTKQTKSFWCKHLLMYRHHCYNFGTVKVLNKDSMNPFDMPVECIAILADQIFIILYNEFVNCRYGTARDFINDLTTLIANKNLVFACRTASIRKNPFCMSETRDVFRKLLGSCRSYPQSMKDFYLLCLSYPIYGTFGGSIYHIFKRWLNAREVSISVDSYLQECWQSPPELQKSTTFVPQSFHRHMLEQSGDQVDKLLFHGCFGLFSSNRLPPTEDSVLEIKKPGAGTKEIKFNKLFETFVEYISSREWFPNEKFVEEDLNMDFKDYLREKVEDFEDEEFRRSMILKMAEKKFKEEFETESIPLKNKDGFHDINSTSKKPCTCNSCLSKGKPALESGKNEASVVLSENNKKSSIVCEKKDCQKTAVSSSDKCTNTAGSSTAIKDLTSDSLTKCHDASVNTVNNESNNKTTKEKKSKKKKQKKCLESKDTDAGVSGVVSQVDVKATISNEVKSGGSGKKEVKQNKDKGESGPEKSIPKPSGSGKAVESASQTGTLAKSESSSTSKSIPVTGASSKNSVELEKIKKNIDTIKQSVEEQTSLSMDGFRLMVETGSLLMSGDSHLKTGNSKAGNQLALQSCAQCSKTEEKPKTFKKCSRCKTENVKWARYYCSRECQAISWRDCHQEEHDEGLLAKK